MSNLPPERPVEDESQELQGWRKRLDRAMEWLGTTFVSVLFILWLIAHIANSPWTTWLGVGLIPVIALTEWHTPRLGLWVVFAPYQYIAMGRHHHWSAAKVIGYYRKAAARGSSFAMNFLGLIYGDGIGVPVDFAEAHRWFMAAALRGSPEGARNLGEIYFKGSPEVPRDLASALTWFQVAKELGWDLDHEAAPMVAESTAGLDPHAIAAVEHQAKLWIASHLGHGRKA